MTFDKLIQLHTHPWNQDTGEFYNPQNFVLLCSQFPTVSPGS